MKESLKSMQRIENKKKKMDALLEIAQLNQNDRDNRATLHVVKEQTIKTITTVKINPEPSPKRLRTEEGQVSVVSPKEETQEIGYSGKPKVYGEEFLALKQALREKSKKIRMQPKLLLRDIGENASITVGLDDRVPLFVSDIQHLLMVSQIGCHSPYSPARWCHHQRFFRLESTVALIVENVSLLQYQANQQCFPFIQSMFEHKLEVVTPFAYKGDIVVDMSSIPLTSTQVRKLVMKYGSLEDAVTNSPDVFDRLKDLFPLQPAQTGQSQGNLPTEDKFPRTQLLMSGWQMVEENFPLPIKGLMNTKYAGYVLTKDSYKEVTPSSPMFGMDCEMCRTTCGDLELTRISIVDENMDDIYDKLVKPYNKITDYLTRFSGITPRMMKNVTKRLSDVQEDIRRILPDDAILVGQSLCNDMHAVKMMHPYIIDTSIIYNITGDRRRKTKLQTLAREFLSERIQEGRGGHCSHEDSAASLKLVQLKLTKDVAFGDAVLGDVSMQICHQPELGHPNYSSSMLKLITKMSKTAQIIGSESIVNKYNQCTFKGKKTNQKIRYVTDNSNEVVIKSLCESLAVKKCSFNIAQVDLAAANSDEDVESMQKTFKQVDSWVKDIYEHLATPGLFVVMFGGQNDMCNGCCFIAIKNA